MNGAPIPTGDGADCVVDLIPLVRRVVSTRVRDRGLVDDLVQETLVRVISARARIGDGALAPYAIVTARNLVVSQGRRTARDRRTLHRALDTSPPAAPDDELLQQEDRVLVGRALARLLPAERELLLAHEVAGTGTAALAAVRGSTPGAIAAQLGRTRAKLRVEYLIAQRPPPGDHCRAVLTALSHGDRRRQRELDTAGHLIACDYCAQLGTVLLGRRASAGSPQEAHVPVRTGADVVAARQKGREVAGRVGFRGTELTRITAAVSEVARNIVDFAGRGEVVVTAVQDAGRCGVTVTARDRGPGIPDVPLALTDGFSTHGGLGLGLPGARRLMDEFRVVSDVGRGTTVTMTRWLCARGTAGPRDAGRRAGG